MSTSIREKIREALDTLRSEAWLGTAHQVGPRARLIGRPYIQCSGWLVIGSDFTLASTPVPSHLIVAPSGRIEIGDAVTIGHGAAIVSERSIRIGSRVHAGPFLNVHDTDFHAVADDPNNKVRTGPIEIGDDVWIGPDVTILHGSRIGAGARIGARSVVMGRIPPGVSAGGVPATWRRDPPPLPRSALIRLEDVPARVASVIAQTFDLTTPPGPEVMKNEVRGWDSVGLLNLTVDLETNLGLVVDAEALATAGSVGDVIRLIESRVADPGPRHPDPA